MKTGKLQQLQLALVLWGLLGTAVFAEQGVLWKVARTGMAASYVFGTIHSDASAVTALPTQVERVFMTARSFTAEMDLNMTVLLQSQTAMLLPDNKELVEVIGPERYKKCVSLMSEYGVPEIMVARMKPWAVAAQLSMPKSTTGIFLDLKLYQMAIAKGIPTYGLETPAEQMDVFDTMTPAQQITMLDEAMTNYVQLPGMIDKLLLFYLQRDLTGMQAFSDDYMQKGDTRLAEVVRRKLIVERNRRMVERMQTRLREGHAFIAVGALHLPGAEGILELLRQRGFRVEAVY